MSAFGGGLFGSSNAQQQQQPGQSGGLFGGLGNANTNASTNTGGLFGSTTGQNAQGSAAPGGGLFGANAGGQAGGAGLFGQSNNQGTTGGGLFGAANTNTNQQVGQPATGGLFGGGTNATQQQQPATGGLFGNTNTQQQGTGSGLFGNTNTQNTQQPSGGGLFGSTNTSSQPSGGLFGNTNTQQPSTGGLFGSTTNQPQQGGGLFGSNANQQQQQQQSGGGLFGSTTNQAGQQSTGTGGLFGTSTAGAGNAAPSGGLFGSAPSTSTTGGLFGSTTANTGASNTGGGLFGSTATGSNTAAQPGLFGQTQQQQQQPGGGLFGQSQAAQQSQQGGLLGSTLFGGAKSQLAPGSSFNASNSLFSSRAAPVPAQQQQDAQSQFFQLSQRIEAIVQAWNPDSPNNRFQHYFYNLVDPSQVHLYGRPAKATNEAAWQKALRENPDPTCLVPVLATSFDDLQKRVEAQAQQAAAHQEKLKEIKSRIEKLSERHELSNASRLHKASSVQTQLTHRLLRLVQHLHLLIPTLRSSAIRPEEEALRAALEEIDGEIRRPGGMGRIVGKLNELWALVGALNAMRGHNAKGTGEGLEWAVVDEDGLNQIVQILAEEQAGLAHLTKILQKDLRDIAVIYGEGEREEEPNPRADLLSSFSQTLRGSTIR